MKSFKQFLDKPVKSPKELAKSKNVSLIASKEPKSITESPLESDNIPQSWGIDKTLETPVKKKFGKMPDHLGGGTIHKQRLPDDRIEYSVKSKTGKHIVLRGSQEGKTFSENFVVKHPEAPFKAADFYKHLIKHHGLTILSDTVHSVGTKKLYMHLSRDPEIHISAHHEDGGSKDNLSTKDVRNYYSSWSNKNNDNFSDNSRTYFKVRKK